VIFDAGSSGTRLHIYRWHNNARARKDAEGDNEELHKLPKIKTKKKWTLKKHPGISTYGSKPTRVGPDYLEALLDHAKEMIPNSEHANTPIFLLATAGMRLLPDDQRNSLLESICSYARQSTSFQLPDCDLHIQVIPGETEGLYGWIAGNYLLGGFDNPKEHDHGKGHHTYGFLDMGGASAQIAFAPNGTEADKHAEDLKLLRLRSIDGTPQEYRVFVTTWLEFGVNEARRRYTEHLIESVGGAALEIPDPCLPAGFQATITGKPIEEGSGEEEGTKPHLVGTGRFAECVKSVYPLLDKDAPCPDAPCLFKGVHVPAIDFDVNHFIGVSEYWHTTHEIFEYGHKDKAYDFATYQARVSEFCSRPWTQIVESVGKQEWGSKVNEGTVREVCFKASWLINVLHDGIGIPRVGVEQLQTGQTHNGTKAVLDGAKDKGYLDPFQAVNKIDGVEVSWTLGKIILYAASQITPPEGAAVQAVGFGNNTRKLVEGGVTPGWQYAGGAPLSLADDLTGQGHDDGDWKDVLFDDDSPRRIPGFLLFILILCVVVFFLCGRERRTALLSKLSRILPGSGKRRRGLGWLPGKLGGGHSGPMYERLEEGVPTLDFELADYDSDLEREISRPLHPRTDSVTGSPQVGKTSGWATPQLTHPGASGLETSPKRGLGFGGNSSTNLHGLGLGQPVQFGPGIMHRVESREKLGSGSASVAGSVRGRDSPKRMWSPAPKESVD